MLRYKKESVNGCKHLFMQVEAIPLCVLPSCKVLSKVDKFIDCVIVKLLDSAICFSV